jgi:hypothetical protein
MYRTPKGLKSSANGDGGYVLGVRDKRIELVTSRKSAAAKAMLVGWKTLNNAIFIDGKPS